MISAYFTKCWNSGFPQYYPIIVFPANYFLSYEICPLFKLEIILSQAYAIKIANPYLYPVYSFISLAYFIIIETFLEETIH